MLKRMLILGGMVSLLLLPCTAFAAFAISDSMIVVDAAGNLLAANIVTELDETVIPDNVWQLDHGIANSAMFGSATAVLEGPTEGVPGTISDIFGVAKDPVSGAFSLAFMSDGDPGGIDLAKAALWFGAWTPSGTVEAPGATWDATPYVNPLYNGGDFKATFTSDTAVPEPATILAGILLLVPFGTSALRILRSHRS